MSNPKSLHQQVNTIIYSQLRFGQSKFKARRDEGTKYPKGIFSHDTFETYMQQCHQFVNWLKGNEELPKVRAIADARKYVGMYLNELKHNDYSAFTVHTTASALAKLFDCRMEDFDVDLDKRERKVIKRSRKEPDPEYERKHQDIVDFYRGCGLRRCEMLRLKGEDVARMQTEMDEMRAKLRVFSDLGISPQNAPAIIIRHADTLAGIKLKISSAFAGTKPMSV